MKKVLVISLAFPPIPNVGVFRITKFCKYLPQFGWQPSVLTQKAIEFYEGTDWTPLEDLKNNVCVIRTPNFQPFYWWDNRSIKKNTKYSLETSNPNYAAFSQSMSLKGVAKRGIQMLRKFLTVPDDRLAWIPQALIPAIRHIRKEKIDIIFSSSPSPTNHILGFILSHVTGVKHVVDFRDLWTLNEVYSTRELPKFLSRCDQFFEEMILQHSKRIVVVNRTLKTQLCDAYPKTCKNKVDYIYNGFDEDDFNKIVVSKTQNDYFTIVYAGSLYGHRSPEFFFKAMIDWMNGSEPAQRKVKVHFYGSANNEYNQRTKDLGLENIVSFHPRVARNDIMQILFNADVSLLIHGFSKLTVSSTSTKLFEYMATGKPILAMLPESEASEILNKYTQSCVVSSPDIGKVVRFLDEQYNRWKNKTSVSRFGNIPLEFSRKGQAEKLASIFDQIVTRR